MPLTAEQTTVIRRHLDMVFVHEIDPSMGPQSHQDKLNEIHNPAPLSWHITNAGGPKEPIKRC